jgi:uncharacterized cupin superfamily protein
VKEDSLVLFKLDGDDWDREEDGFRVTAVGERLAAELLGASLYEVAPGESTWPYHFHHGDEELLIVLSGRLRVRTPAGERELERGDVVLFRRGSEGAHEERNEGSEPARFLLVSTRPPLEVTEEPDSGRVNVYARDGALRLRRTE